MQVEDNSHEKPRVVFWLQNHRFFCKILLKTFPHPQLGLGSYVKNRRKIHLFIRSCPARKRIYPIWIHQQYSNIESFISQSSNLSLSYWEVFILIKTNHHALKKHSTCIRAISIPLHQSAWKDNDSNRFTWR